MITVQVSDQYDIHLVRGIAGGFEVVDDIAETGAEELGSAGIDQYQFVAGVDQERIDGGLYGRTLDEQAGEEFLDILVRGVLEQLGIEIDGAIVKGGDLEFAEEGALVAGHLGFLLRRFGDRKT